jgi:hypothetical protein
MAGKRFVFIVLSPLLLGAQSPPQSPAADVADTALAKGRYLEASDALAAAAFGPDGKVRDEDAFQMWEQVSPMLTNELDPAVLARAEPGSPPDPSWATRVAAATPHDAIEEIVRRARDTSIVILNEAHDSPRDRAFALQVARALKPLGYSILAAETFDSEPAEPGHASMIDKLRQDGFVRISTGYYTRDPVFAGFVREALALGYRPVGYEQTSKQRPKEGGIAPREQAQAENLAAILAAKPSAKALIYVGYGHVWEAPINFQQSTTDMMATRLKRLTGIDPLTIDQTSLTDLASAARAAYAVAARRIGNRPSVFLEGNNPLILGRYAGAVDLQVVHPARAYRYGRPQWLVEMGGTPLAIPKELRPTSGRRLIQVFAADAPPDAVPLDQIVVQAGAPLPMLFAPAVPVRFTIGS